jgi:hypothetical protein
MNKRRGSSLARPLAWNEAEKLSEDPDGEEVNGRM